MNKLNNKFLWILLCIGNNGFGMDALSLSESDPSSFLSYLGLPNPIITFVKSPVNGYSFSNVRTNVLAITGGSTPISYVSQPKMGRDRSMDQALLPYVVDEPKFDPNIKVRGYKKKPSSYYLKNHWLFERLLRIIPDAELEDIKKILAEMPQFARDGRVLCKAVNNERHDCLELFLAHEANPNILTGKGNSLLHKVNIKRTAQLLVDYGACVKHKNNGGRTAFFSAIKKSCLGVASVLLKAGANINDGDNKNNTPLHYAVMNLHPRIIKFLLYHEADPNLRNNQGVSPYEMALDCGGDVLQVFQECIKVFFAINTTVKDNPFLTVMNLLAHDGRQLKNILRLDASGCCSSDIVVAEQLLQQCGDEVWNELSHDFSSCSGELLWLAKLIKNRSQHRENFLQELHKNSFFIAKQLVNINPYILYVSADESDVVSDLFIDKFFSMSSSDSNYRHIVELLHAGFDLNIRDDQDSTLLCKLIRDFSDTKKYVDLLRNRVSVNTMDIYGKTALSYAVLLRDENKVKTLLRYDAVVHPAMLKVQCGTSLELLLAKVFEEQKCFVCGKHPEDMSNIPCLKRHSGSFICQECYNDKNGQCPVCFRVLDEYGM